MLTITRHAARRHIPLSQGSASTRHFVIQDGCAKTSTAKYCSEWEVRGASGEVGDAMKRIAS